jgi:two-component system cell cycle response regulator
MARILVIEDNQANLDLMAYLIKSFGHTPLGAGDGEEGLEVARRETPDLIICDIQLPKMDGYGVVKQLKSHPALSKIPIIAVTAFAMVGDREGILKAGFDGYISKPIDPGTFIAQVEALLKPDQRSAPKPHAQAQAVGVEPLPSKGATILVVDNSQVNIDLTRSTLEPFGYRIIAAHSVREALALARQTPPDLILSDIHMPGESGMDFIKAAKADSQLKSIPFVFISSTVWGEKDRTAGLDIGATKFILRPIEPQVLLKEIEECLGVKHDG